jgi:hypothetical protein
MSEAPTTSTVPAATTPSEAPAGVIAVQMNGKHVRLITGTLKGKTNKGFPTFKFVPSGDLKKNPSLSDVLSLATTLDINEELAVLINREIIGELSADVAEAIRSKNADGSLALNWALAPKAAKDIMVKACEERESAKSLLEHLVDLGGELKQLYSKVMAEFAAGKNPNTDPGLKALTNQVSQLSLKISELETKRATAKRKGNTAAAPTAPAVVK